MMTPGWLFSRTLEVTDWPGIEIVRDDVVSFVRELKRESGSELRTLGSESLVKQLLTAGPVDCLKLVVCPLVLPRTASNRSLKGCLIWGSNCDRAGFWTTVFCFWSIDPRAHLRTKCS